MLEARGVEVARVAAGPDGRLDLREALAWLARRGITRVLGEGGPRVGSRLVEQGLADEVKLFTATKPLGRAGLPALDAAAEAALRDPARYREMGRALYPPDELRQWERCWSAGGDDPAGL
jgi:diaminohydroxyphosphoribosylaminopyrimidine deaminase/5-amino-6-(5-phosphoribosylamino)uracil reductase